MALQSIQLSISSLTIVEASRSSLQQDEFNKAHDKQGCYVIVDYWGNKYIHPSYEMELEYIKKYKDMVYNNRDITDQSYKNMVQLFIDIYTGKLTFTEDSLPYELSHTLLKWLPMDIVESNAWSYDQQDNTPDFTWPVPIFNPWSLNINPEKAELYILKKNNKLIETRIRETFALVNSILQSSDDPLTLMVGVLNPLIHLSPEDDVVSKCQESIDLAPFLPEIGSEFKKALERFDK
jgi:hypothetical protein